MSNQQFRTVHESERNLFANVSVVQESEKYHLLNGKTTYYVCRGHVCLPPSNEYIAE